MIFRDRDQAGEELAKALEPYRGKKPVVLAIPRGGIVVGYHVAAHLGCPLDIVVPRKIGAPFNPEFAIGAVAEDGSVLLDEGAISSLRVPQSYIHSKIEEEVKEIKRRISTYRSGRPEVSLKGRTAIVVDDGIATGATMRVAVKFVKSKQPMAVVVATPVAPREVIQLLKEEADDVVCLATPEPFFAIGQFYEKFEQLDDYDVIELLKKAHHVA